MLENNINYKGNKKAKFYYHGFCEEYDTLLSLRLKNDDSNEIITMNLINPVGNLQRHIGILLGTSSNGIPTCVKVDCFKEQLKDKVNIDKISEILSRENTLLNFSTLYIEENEKMLFFSDYILNYKIHTT